MPFIIKTNLVDVNKAEWNLTGDVFTISGMIRNEENKCGVSFYTSKGDFIKVFFFLIIYNDLLYYSNKEKYQT